MLDGHSCPSLLILLSLCDVIPNAAKPGESLA
jgi:hypothetical protein